MADSSDLALKYISESYFANETVLVVYWNNTTFDLGERYVRFLVDSEISALEFCCVDRVNVADKARRSHVENIVILLNDVILDEQRIRMMRNCDSWNSKSKIVVLVENETEETVRELLREFWELTRAINVTVMSTSVKFYTLQPYKNFIMEELLINNLFPHKIPKNFNGSVIYAVRSPVKPFVILDQSGNDDGIEIRIVKAISKHLNFRVEYKKIPPGEAAWHSMRTNGRMMGALGVLDRLEAEILFHGVPFHLDKYVIGDEIAIHTIDKLLWIVPVYPFVFDWRGLFIMFELQLWGILLAFLILISLTVYILTKPGYELFTFTDAFFQVLAQLLSSPTLYYHDGYIYRIFMILFSFYNLIIISSYQSSLITFLTTPQEGKQYESLEQAVDDGLVATLYPGINYNTSNHDFWNKVLAPGRHLYSLDYEWQLETIHYNKSVFFRGSDINLRRWVRDFYEKKGIRLVFKKMEEMSEIFCVTMLATKGHPLLNLLRINVMRLVESGLVRYWADEFVADSENKGLESNEPFALTLTHFNGIFLIGSGLMGFAFWVFVCEVVYGKREVISKKFCGVGLNGRRASL